MNELRKALTSPQPSSLSTGESQDQREAYSSRTYERAGSGFPDSSTSKKHQASSREIASDYQPGLSRPIINRGPVNLVREIIVEDDDIDDLRRKQGYARDRNHADEMKKMMSLLHEDVLGKGAIHAARDVYATASRERTDELSLHIACLPIILKMFEDSERLKKRRADVPFVLVERYVAQDRISVFCKTPIFIDTSATMKRLFFAKRVGRKAPSGSNEDFQNLMQLTHPEDPLPALSYFMRSAQEVTKLHFTQLYVTDKRLGKVPIPDIYNKSITFGVGKCVLVFMSMNERAFGFYILCDLWYEPRHRFTEVEEAAAIPRVAETRRILSGDSGSRKKRTGGHTHTTEARSEDRLYELLTRYFSASSKVKYHHVAYKDIFGDGTDDRSPLGALLDSACFRAQFLDAGFIPTVE